MELKGKKITFNEKNVRIIMRSVFMLFVTSSLEASFFSDTKDLVSSFVLPTLEEDFCFLGGEGPLSQNPCLKLADLLERHKDWVKIFPDQVKALQRFLETKPHKGQEKQLAAFFKKYPPLTLAGWKLYVRVAPKVYLAQLRDFWIQTALDDPKQKEFLITFKQAFSLDHHISRVLFLLSQGKKALAQSLVQALGLERHHPLVIALSDQDKDPGKSPFNFIHHFCAFGKISKIKTLSLIALWHRILEAHKTLNVPPILAEKVKDTLSKKQIALLRHAFQEGTHLAKNGKTDEAEAVFKAALKVPVGPNLSQWRQAVYVRGLIYAFGLNNWKQAKTHFAYLAMPALRKTIPSKAVFGREVRHENLIPCVGRLKTSAWFWLGMCQEKLGQSPVKALIQASQEPFFFHGQMACLKLKKPLKCGFAEGNPKLANKKLKIFEDFLEVGKKNPRCKTRFSDRFIHDLKKNVSNVHDMAYALKLVASIDPLSVTITARHFASRGACMTLSQTYPTCDLPIPFKDPSLVYAIILTETGFDGRIVSHLDTWGPMQLVPKETPIWAKLAKIPHDPERRDWTYGLILGIKEVEQKKALFQDCLPLTIAAYNGGRTKVLSWIDEFLVSGDLINSWRWLETIPYDETRQYAFDTLANWFVYESLSKKSVTPEFIEKTINIPLKNYRIH